MNSLTKNRQTETSFKSTENCPNTTTWRGLCCMMYLRREGPKTDLGGSLLDQRQKNYHKYYHAVCIHLKRSLSCKYYTTRYREEEGRVVGCRKPHRDLTIQHLLNPSHQDFIFNVSNCRSELYHFHDAYERQFDGLQAVSLKLFA